MTWIWVLALFVLLVVALVFPMLVKGSFWSVCFATDTYEPSIDFIGCPSDAFLGFVTETARARIRAPVVPPTFEIAMTANQVAALVRTDLTHPLSDYRSRRLRMHLVLPWDESLWRRHRCIQIGGPVPDLILLQPHCCGVLSIWQLG